MILSLIDELVLWILKMAFKTAPGFLSEPVHELQWWFKENGLGWHHQGYYVLMIYLMFLVGVFGLYAIPKWGISRTSLGRHCGL